EAFTAQVALARRRAGTAALRATPRPLLPPERAANSVLAAFDRRIPFALTGAQVRVGQVLAAHLSGASPMQRLLQGDVGSGKTVVALRAMLQTVDAGGQAVLLAPTEILAVQHYQTLSNLLGPLSGEGLFAPEAAPGGEVPAADAGPQGSDGAPRGVVVRLLTGSLGAAQRRSTLADLAEGRADIAIGTHALLSEPVGFADLGLVVIDEQHRFGVEQRDVLRSRGAKPPHVLVMTATPIPRSIAMTYFGDLETVTLDELPGGRPPVTTHVVPTSKPKWVARAWERIGEEARSGHGVFVVCPRIDAQDRTDPEGAPPAAGSDGSKAARPPTPSPDLENGSGPGGETQRPPLATVEDTLERIRREPGLRDLRSEAIHGRLSAEAKEQIMSSFASGQIDVLVATTVIEVGVDVPRATLMVVLDADRFGLAALHQLRGRIGRGRDPGVCLLVSGAEPETPAARRLAAMEQHRDGVKLSEIDLELRREGDVLGADQSGRGKSLRLLRVIRDRDLIAHTRFIAIDLIAGDPRLLGHPDLADFLARRLGDREDFLERA
ncbi:MAG: ATP-dependent DNA helicase RecG, partial [Bifidobacteriaceae bacterium]|nr:ATP-dependent DNA helicase RecG [Bifidobacteriaceae bacterium]